MAGQTKTAAQIAKEIRDKVKELVTIANTLDPPKRNSGKHD